MLKQYDIKINKGNGFLWAGSEYLNPFSSEKKKNLEIERIRNKYKIKKGEYLNISNFFNVYC